MTFFGLPPFWPLTRAASALASLRALPPFRPSATAAGFLRGTADRQRGIPERLAFGVGRDRAVDVGADLVVGGAAQAGVFGHTVTEIVGGEAVHLLAGALSLGEHPAEAVGVASESSPELVRRELCEEASLFSHRWTIPNRLGFVNRVKHSGILGE
jgi:hypothetical protein